MKEGTRNSLVGLFTISSIVALAALMVMFGEAPDWLGKGDWQLTITGVREIRGISPGTAVYLNGVEIGRVNRLQFEVPSRPGLGVQVVAKIKQQYSVPRGSTAKMYGATLGIGSGQVHIVVGDAAAVEPLPKEGATIHGEMASAFGEIISKELTSSVQRTVDHIGNFAHAATPLADHLSNLLEERTIDQVDHPMSPADRIPANLATAIERFDRLVLNVNTVLGDQEVQADVKGIADDLKTASAEIRELVELWHQETRRISDNVNEGVDSTEKNLDESFDKLIVVIENLDRSTKKLTEILDGIAAGEGTAGMLVRDERLYEAAVLALQRLSDTLASINRITGKIEEDGYIQVGQATPVGTFKKKLPVPGSAEEKK